jgi:uncharacterized protein (TIGR02391 family)
MSDEKQLQALTPTQKALLAKVLSSSEGAVEAPTAERFRAENYQHISLINEFERLGWIHRVDERYAISPTVLPLLGSSTAKRVLKQADAVYRALWNRYRRDQSKQVPVADLAKEVGAPVPEVAGTLRMMVQISSWWSGHSNDFLDAGAFVAPSEGILADVSFTAVARQAHFANASGPVAASWPGGQPEGLEGQMKWADRLAPTGRETDSLHPKIAEAVGDLMANGHPWEAVFAACKSLILHVKECSGRHDLDGVPLMRQVFSRNKPILRFNALQSTTDNDEQEGMMHLYEGVIMALRNPGGHSFPTGPSSRASQYLQLISMLAERADEASSSAASDE